MGYIIFWFSSACQREITNNSCTWTPCICIYGNQIYSYRNLATNKYPNIFVSKKLTRTNIRIYSYKKIDTNEYPNKFSDKKYSNIQIYLSHSDGNSPTAPLPNCKWQSASPAPRSKRHCIILCLKIKLGLEGKDMKNCQLYFGVETFIILYGL